MTLEGLEISLIALPPILGAALAALLRSEGGGDVTLHSIVSCECDSADILLTSIDHYAAHLDYFLPRKGKVALLFQNKTSETPPHVCSIFLDDDPAQMFRRLAEVARPVHNIVTENHVLTARELDVLKEIALGKTNKEIADSLTISVNTVITHRKNVSQKLGIRSASGLSLYALMNGLI